MVQKHFVTFYSPGTFVAEESTKSIDAWDVEKAKKMARSVKERYGAVPYGFRFTTRSRGPKDLDSHVTASSPFYWLGGKVETLEELKARATKADEILVSNMEGNGWPRIITNNNSWRWTQPLAETDVVLEFKAVRGGRSKR
jgi:hypothetical protein